LLRETPPAGTHALSHTDQSIHYRANEHQNREVSRDARTLPAASPPFARSARVQLRNFVGEARAFPKRWPQPRFVSIATHTAFTEERGENLFGNALASTRTEIYPKTD